MDEVEGVSRTVTAACAIGIARRTTRRGIDRNLGSNSSIFVSPEKGLSAIDVLLVIIGWQISRTYRALPVD
jgi:hypothetical protein